MKIENQVTSLELSKKLKELGVEQESLWYWNGTRLRLEKDISSIGWGNGKSYSAFTVAELGELLPDNYHTYRKGGDKLFRCEPDRYLIKEGIIEYDWRIFEDKNEADARAKQVAYLKENDLIK